MKPNVFSHIDQLPLLHYEIIVEVVNRETEANLGSIYALYQNWNQSWRQYLCPKFHWGGKNTLLFRSTSIKNRVPKPDHLEIIFSSATLARWLQACCLPIQPLNVLTYKLKAIVCSTSGSRTYQLCYHPKIHRNNIFPSQPGVEDIYKNNLIASKNYF